MDNEDIQPDYLKGFNEGYTLKKHLPDLADQVALSLSQSRRAEGFRHGRDQVEQEKNREAYPAWLKKDRVELMNKEPEHTKEKGHDLDDYER